MSIESEIRIGVSEVELPRIEAACALGAPLRVTDLTFGCSGATSIQTHGWVLRIRLVEGEPPSLQVKKNLDASMTVWLEEAVVVDSVQRLLKLLDITGVKPGLLIDRTRRSGRLNGCTVSVDRIEGLGLFVEVEQVSTHVNLVTSSLLHDTAVLLNLGGRVGARPYGAALLERLNADASFREWHDEQVTGFMRRAMSDA